MEQKEASIALLADILEVDGKAMWWDDRKDAFRRELRRSDNLRMESRNEEEKENSWKEGLELWNWVHLLLFMI